jgi:hypothetical protein
MKKRKKRGRRRRRKEGGGGRGGRERKRGEMGEEIERLNQTVRGHRLRQHASGLIVRIENTK